MATQSLICQNNCPCLSAGPLASSDAPTLASLIPLVASISPELQSKKENKGQIATLQIILRICTEVSTLRK